VLEGNVDLLPVLDAVCPDRGVFVDVDAIASSGGTFGPLQRRKETAVKTGSIKRARVKRDRYVPDNHPYPSQRYLESGYSRRIREFPHRIFNLNSTQMLSVL
jgi:hypothetical protein